MGHGANLAHFSNPASFYHEAILLKVKLHIAIHGDEVADQLANEAANECCMGRHFDNVLSND